MTYIWLFIVIVLGIIEAMTVNLVSIWFVISGIVAMIISVFIDNLVIEFGVFVILGIIIMIGFRKYVIPDKNDNNKKTNLDRIIGSKGIVTETIYKDKVGEVKIDGKKWSSISKRELKEGTLVRILDIDGVKLIVEEWSDN